MAIKIDLEKEWTFKESRSILSFCLLKQVIRDFENSCHDVLGDDPESDPEVEFLLEVLNGLLPGNTLSSEERRFDKAEIVSTETLSEMYNIAEQCLNDPLKSLEFSIHNSLNYFLEDCGEMPDLSNNEIKVKVLNFMFPDLKISENKVEEFFQSAQKEYRNDASKSLEVIYLHKISVFMDDILELRSLVK